MLLWVKCSILMPYWSKWCNNIGLNGVTISSQIHNPLLQPHGTINKSDPSLTICDNDEDIKDSVHEYLGSQDIQIHI